MSLAVSGRGPGTTAQGRTAQAGRPLWPPSCHAFAAGPSPRVRTSFLREAHLYGVPRQAKGPVPFTWDFRWHLSIPAQGAGMQGEVCPGPAQWGSSPNPPGCPVTADARPQEQRSLSGVPRELYQVTGASFRHAQVEEGSPGIWALTLRLSAFQLAGSETGHLINLVAGDGVR